jgi:hypothetical protein
MDLASSQASERHSVTQQRCRKMAVASAVAAVLSLLLSHVFRSTPFGWCLLGCGIAATLKFLGSLLFLADCVSVQSASKATRFCQKLRDYLANEAT